MQTSINDSSCYLITTKINEDPSSIRELPSFLTITSSIIKNNIIYILKIPSFRYDDKYNILNLPKFAENFSKELDLLLYSSLKYSPALFFTKKEIKKKYDSKSDFLEDFIRLLRKFLECQKQSKFILIEKKVPKEEEFEHTSFVWVIDYNYKTEIITYIDDWYFDYEESHKSNFKLKI